MHIPWSNLPKEIDAISNLFDFLSSVKHTQTVICQYSESQ